MKPGLSRFNYFFDKLQLLFTTAAKQRNPALWLYRNDARTTLFMLEALSRMYADFHNKKRFTKLKVQVKLLEDALGAIDYYDNMARDLAAQKKVLAPSIGYLQAQSRRRSSGSTSYYQKKNGCWLKITGSAGLRISLKAPTGWMKTMK